MSKEELRKLLGGYATNTLTESERSALFEAALDDQELFDALQQEQALKDVLADPRARAEIRQALDRPRPARAAWWSWGGAIATAAAAAVLIAVFWPRPNPVLEKPTEIASAQKLPSPPSQETPLDALKEQSPPPPAPRATTRKPTAAPPAATPASSAGASAPAPPTPSPIISQAPSSAQQQTQGAIALSQGALRSEQLATDAGNGLNRAGIVSPLLGYTLVKQAAGKDAAPIASYELKPGDLIRIRVSTLGSGRLLLTRLDSAGIWQPIGSFLAQPNSSYLLPSDPIAVTTDAQKFRLTFEPIQAQAKAAGSRAQLSMQPAAAPIEITIVANAR